MLTPEQERLEAIGDQLRAKITSKFTASTFLAGFALTVLVGQVSTLWQTETLPPLFAFSVGAVFFAFSVFVYAIIKFDEKHSYFEPDYLLAKSPCIGSAA